MSTVQMKVKDEKLIGKEDHDWLVSSFGKPKCIVRLFDCFGVLKSFSRHAGSML